MRMDMPPARLRACSSAWRSPSPSPARPRSSASCAAPEAAAAAAPPAAGGRRGRLAASLVRASFMAACRSFSTVCARRLPRLGRLACSVIWPAQPHWPTLAGCQPISADLAGRSTL